MKNAYISLILFITFINTSFKNSDTTFEDWGFFGHRKINRYAVFTLPEEMMPLYKKYIDYLEEHAVDPDKRRYATKFEAIRHYIDLDQWGNYPFKNLPRNFSEALSLHSEIYYVNNKDTVRVEKSFSRDSSYLLFNSELEVLSNENLYNFFSKKVLPLYYEDEWKVNLSEYNNFGKIKTGTLIIVDTFSQHGILPYYLPMALSKLKKAFEQGNINDIIRHSADIGHYIGDAHVPLHTTKNYNGQLSNQLGIHAFWESRLPELFAETEYDFFAGKAEVITNPSNFFWDIILESHSHLEAVLGLEKQLSISFPSDQQFCFDERLGQTVRIQCEEYSKAYHEALQGMVEERMISSIKAIGSIWYTAWIDAGQPDLKTLLSNSKNMSIIPEEIKTNPNLKVREHGD